jgi:glutamate/tyrosine decarboxylase-like PLP-dependent enzyme
MRPLLDGAGRRLLDVVGGEWTRLERDLEGTAVAPMLDRDAIRGHLARYDFAAPADAGAMLRDVAELLRRGSVQTTHPRYFGLFCPSVHPVTVAADALAALHNPQLASWAAAPAANEIERHVLGFLAARIGYDPATAAAHFTSGGMESNLTGLSVALANTFPEIVDRGLRALPGPPTVYVSEQGHASVDKAAVTLGLGRGAVRRVAVNDRLELDAGALARAIDADRAAGALPLCVVATAGTTAAGAIDPLAAIAERCRAEGIWCHVDAAWGGGALLSPALSGHLAGIAEADSVSWDAHKWLSVPMGAGMFFCRHRDAVAAAFDPPAADYLAAARTHPDDNYRGSLQWSRRFIGLKLFAALAAEGAGGLGARIDHQAAMGDGLRWRLRRAGWTLRNASPLPVVCFSHADLDAGELSAAALVGAIQRSGAAWLSLVDLRGRPALRACITSFRTDEADLDALVDLLDDQRRRLLE